VADLPIPVADFQVDTSGETAILRISGEVDISTAPQLRERLQQLESRSVVVDLSAMTFIDSTGLGVLVGAFKRLRESGGDLVLRAPTLSARKVLELTGLSQLVTIED
jgi:anti-sigma B factor antagonist